MSRLNEAIPSEPTDTSYRAMRVPSSLRSATAFDKPIRLRKVNKMIRLHYVHWGMRILAIRERRDEQMLYPKLGVHLGDQTSGCAARPSILVIQTRHHVPLFAVVDTSPYHVKEFVAEVRCVQAGTRMHVNTAHAHLGKTVKLP